MTQAIWPAAMAMPAPEPSDRQGEDPLVDSARKIERLLWAEMLSNAGFEDAIVGQGGEAVSAFSRYVVEAIAEDLSERHPLGLSAQIEDQTRAPVTGVREPG